MNKKILIKSFIMTSPIILPPFFIVSCSNNTNLPKYANEAISLISEKKPENLVKISIKDVPANEMIQNIEDYVLIEFNKQIQEFNNRIQNDPNLKSEHEKNQFKIQTKLSIRIPNLSKETKEIDKLELKLLLTAWNVESKVGTFDINISQINKVILNNKISNFPNKGFILEKINEITRKIDKSSIVKENIDRRLSYGLNGNDFDNIFIKWDEKPVDNNSINIYCYFNDEKLDDISEIKDHTLYFFESFLIGNN